MERIEFVEAAKRVRLAITDGEAVGVSWLQRKYRLGYQSGLALKQDLIAHGVVFPALNLYAPETMGTTAAAAGGKNEQ